MKEEHREELALAVPEQNSAAGALMDTLGVTMRRRKGGERRKKTAVKHESSY